MLNNAIYTLKTVEIQDGYIIASVLSKELNLLGKLKFYCWDAKNLATECIHTWPADAL